MPFSPITRFVSEPPFTVLNTIHSKQLMLSTGRFSYTSPLSGLSLKILGLLPITTCHSTCVTSVAPTRYAVKLTGLYSIIVFIVVLHVSIRYCGNHTDTCTIFAFSTMRAICAESVTSRSVLLIKDSPGRLL